MEQPILSALRQIENKNGVEILLAVESGSRAWGFASADSDYDVRFVYKRSLRDYLRVRIPPDVIELPIVDELDVNGWDLLKALRLFHKSNPSLMEWLFSPVVYLERGTFAAQLREWVQEHYSYQRLVLHYLNMAKGTYRSHLQGKREIPLKKYLYVLRPLVCIRWVEQCQSAPPTSIWTVLEGIKLPSDVRSSLMELLHRKMVSDELGAGPTDPHLDRFIQSELIRIPEAVTHIPDRTPPESTLDGAAWVQLGL